MFASNYLVELKEEAHVWWENHSLRREKYEKGTENIPLSNCLEHIFAEGI